MSRIMQKYVKFWQVLDVPSVTRVPVGHLARGSARRPDDFWEVREVTELIQDPGWILADP